MNDEIDFTNITVYRSHGGHQMSVVMKIIYCTIVIIMKELIMDDVNS